MSKESKMLPKTGEATPTLKAIAPCLRSRSENVPKREPRKVSFPDEETDLVTGYLEPANPWEYAENVSLDELISTYKASCEKHGTDPLPQVLKQLELLDIDAVRNECLDLKGETLESSHCETLEEVLKRVQFKNINLEGTSLDDEGSVALFDMVEYYESAIHLNISSNKKIGVRGWQACSRMIKKTRCLEQLEARNVTLNEQFMPILSRALRISTQLQILKLENCNLTGRPIIILAAALKLNTGLRELYLADNCLNVTDAIQLGGLLRSNFTLQLLDISNNDIQDMGLGHISDGLTEQTPGQSGTGLSILVLWNNHLTRNASKHFARAVARSQSLDTLNIGQNMLTNECLHVMKDSLQQNRTLLRLGMQSTHLTCEGAIALAESIADNPVIQRIDLRDNNLKVAGLMALALSMKVNTSVTQLDLDSEPKKKEEKDNNIEQYRKLVSEIREYCSRNEVSAREEEDTVEEGPATPARGRIFSATSRKISLTCETLLRTTAMPPQPVIPDSGLLTEPRRSSGRLRSPAPSPIPSPVSSPVPSPSRTRFQVSKVTESSPFLSTGQTGSPTSTSSSPITPPSLSSSPSRFFPSPTSSRFRVTLVEPSPSPTVTSPSGNVTVGFNFMPNDSGTAKQQNFIASIPATHVEKTSAPEIVVTTLSSSSTTQQTPTSQNVKITVKLDPENDNLIIENETSMIVSDEPEDTDDLEVRSILDQACIKEEKNWVSSSEQDLEGRSILDQGCVEEDKNWVSSSVQDSVTLLRRAGHGIATSPEEESGPQLSSSNLPEQFIPVHDKDTNKILSSESISHTSDVNRDSVNSKPCLMGNKTATESKLELKEGDHIDVSINEPETVENNIKRPLISMSPAAPALSPACVQVLPVEQSQKISWTASSDSDDSVRKPENNVKQSMPSSTPISAAAPFPTSTFGPISPAQLSQKISCISFSDSEDSIRKPETVENNIKQSIPIPGPTPVAAPTSTPAPGPVPPAQRIRKISWISPSDLDDNTRKSETVENNVKQSVPSPVPAAAPAPPAQRSRKISWIASSDTEEPKSGLERLLGLFHHPGSFFSKSHQQYKATAAIANQRPVTNSNASFLLTSGPLAAIANGGNGVLSTSLQSRDGADAEQSKETSHDSTSEVKLSPKQSPGVLWKEEHTTNCENPIPDVINNNNKVEDISELGASVLASSEQLSEDRDKHIRRHCEDENYNLPKSYENIRETKVNDDNGTKSSSQIAQAVSVRSSNPSGDLEGSEETSENYCDSECNISSTQGEVKAVCISDKAQCDSDGADKTWSRSCESSYVQGSAATVRLVGGAPGFEFPPSDSNKDEASGIILPDLSVDAASKSETV